MSNDVSAPSTSVEIEFTDSDDQSQPVDAADTQVAHRVPVEVVVQGVDDAEESFTDELPEPAAEVAQLLGQTESKPTGDDAVKQPPVVQPSVETLSVETPSVETPSVVAEKPSVVAEKPSVVTEEPSAEELTADPFVAEEVNEFEEMGLSPGVMAAIETAGYTTPSPIQQETVPYILEGRDLMGQAETGSGKTAAFAWPLLSRIDMKLAKPQVLVLAPTRELAIQVTAAFEKYAAGIKGFRAVTIYGGQSYDTQLRALSRGVQVVVGTPGRVMDHLRRKTLDLRSLKTLVLDEADEMLRMGFIDDVEWILEQTPSKRQILSFSATLPEPIQRIAKKYLNDPAHVTIKSKSATADSIEQSCLFLSAREKMERLVRILETEETEGVLVFVKTRNSTILLAENLIQRGIIASPLNGDIPQNQRERTVNQLKSGRINVVVATDVAARGLDVQRISHVINYDFPHDTEAYVHRIGRTGRAGRTGNAILFVEPKEKGKLSRLQRSTNQRIEQFKQKSIDEVNQVRVEKFKQRITEAMQDKQLKYFTNLISEFQDETELPFNEIAGALAVLAQGETPLLLKELGKSKSNWRKDDDKRGSGGRHDRGAMTTFRLEVGREHGVGPGNIVGAITNEANLNNGDIGRINIFDRFSTIDLPADLPQDVIGILKNVHVSGQRLAISKSDKTYAKPGGRKSGPSHGGARYDKSKKFGDKKYGDKKYGNKSFGDKKFADRTFGDKKYASKPAAEKTYTDKPTGEKKFGDKPSAEKKYGDKPSAEKKYGDKPAGEKKYGAKKPFKSKSNSSTPRTELGEKRDRYAKDAETKSFRSKFSKPKTKAAERTKAKRKPGAKPSNPMKKYVKIRSAK